MQDLLAAASLVIELSIAALPFVHIASKFMPRKPQPVPGQLEIDFTILAAVKSKSESQSNNIGTHALMVALPDPWECLSKEATAPVSSTTAPLHTSPTFLQWLPPSKEQTPAKPNYSAMTRDDLRRACQKQGIKWRDAKGKNRHLTVEEMRSALAAAA